MFKSTYSRGSPFANYAFQDGLLRKKGKLVVGPNSGLRQQILKWMHDSATSGHSSRETTLKRLQTLLY